MQKIKIILTLLLLSLCLVSCNSKENISNNIEETQPQEQITEKIESNATKSNNDFEESQPQESLPEIEESITTSDIKDDDKGLKEETLPQEFIENIEDETTSMKKEEYKPISISFTGDIYFSDKLNERYKENNSIDGFLSSEIKDVFLNSDIMVCNHEYACTDLPDSKKDTRQLYNFKAPKDREFIWNELGVDVLSLANNHAMDYGVQSLYDSLDAINELGIQKIGAGINLEDALTPATFEIQGKKIGILGSCRFIVDTSWYVTKDGPGVLTTYESTPYFGYVKDKISKMKNEENYDFVIVFVHFGKEKTTKLLDNQFNIAHGYIDSGADAVIGSHTHNLQGMEIYEGKPIYYNLGNFLFGSYEVDTMTVTLFINEDNTCTSKITPARAKNYKIETLKDEKALTLYEHLNKISVNTYIDENGYLNLKEK